MTIFEECIQALGPGVKLLSEKETVELFEVLTNTFPYTKWGRVDWERVRRKIEFDDPADILRNLNIGESSVYVLWNDASVPALITNLKTAINVIDDVIAVGFDTWFFDIKKEWVIEFYHEGDITLGYFVED